MVSVKKIVYEISMHTKTCPCRGGAIFDPRGMVGRIYKANHNTLLHTKYESSGPCVFFFKDFFMFFP